MKSGTRFRGLPPEPCTKSHEDSMRTFQIMSKRDLKLTADFFLVAAMGREGTLSLIVRLLFARNHSYRIRPRIIHV